MNIGFDYVQERKLPVGREGGQEGGKKENHNINSNTLALYMHNNFIFQTLISCHFTSPWKRNRN